MTEQEYNKAPGIRRSLLWEIRRSPAHLKWRMENPPEATPALIFGQALHAAVLTPEDYGRQFAVMPDADRRTKAGREAWEAAAAEAQGRTQIAFDWAEQIACMVQAVRGNPMAARLLDGPHETSYFWADTLTGESCKCRTDAETDIGDMHLIVDLKSCQDASTDAFMRDALHYGYDVQAAMYTDGVRTVTDREAMFVFIAVEKAPPYAVNILQADTLFMQHGQDRYRHLLGLYHECRQRNQWPGYTGFDGDIASLGLPAWLAKDYQ